jgi:hypothetical protein
MSTEMKPNNRTEDPAGSDAVVTGYSKHSDRREGMSAYERRALEQSLKRLHEPTRRAIVPTKVREFASTTTDKAAQFADAHLPAATVKSIVEKTLNGTSSSPSTPPFDPRVPKAHCAGTR